MDVKAWLTQHAAPAFGKTSTRIARAHAALTEAMDEYTAAVAGLADLPPEAAEFARQFGVHSEAAHVGIVGMGRALCGMTLHLPVEAPPVVDDGTDADADADADPVPA